MEQEDKKPIDLKSLSLEERKELAAQLKEEERQEKERKQNETKVLQELTEEVIDKNIDDCLKVQGISNDFILKLFQEAETIITARAETYGNKKRDQDSHTLTKRDGSASIKLGWNVKPTFDGTETEGIAKIKEYMTSLTSDEENSKIMMEFLNEFLKTDMQGNYNPKQVRKLNEKRDTAKSQLFNDGMDIVEKAIIDIRTSQFVIGYKVVEFEPGVSKRFEFSFSIK